MKITCPGCKTSYRIPDEKVPVGGARASCPNCGQQILIAPKNGGARPGVSLTGSSSADFGQTIAYDFSEVDQSRTEISALLEKISDREPFIEEGFEFVLKDTQTGEEFPASGPRTTVGRSGCDINLNDPEVSRRHCEVRVFGTRIVIVDLESTNGTFVGGKKVMTATIGEGETFTMGNTTLEPVFRKAG